MEATVKHINISKAKIEQAMQSASYAEGMALSVFIKCHYVNSVLNTDKVYLVSQIIGCGKDRTKRIINSAVKHGFVKVANGKIYANRIKGIFGLNFSVNRIEGTRYKDIMNLFRQLHFENHVRKTMLACDTYDKAYDQSLTHNQSKKFVKLVKKYGVRGRFNFKSIKGIAKLMNCSERTASTILAKMKELGLIEAIHNRVVKRVDAFDFNWGLEPGMFIKGNYLIKVAPNTYTLGNNAHKMHFRKS